MTLLMTDKHDANLNRVTYRLHEINQQQKILENEKKQLREQFFALANDDICTNRKLGRKSVEHMGNIFTVHRWVAEQHPGWRVLDMEEPPSESETMHQVIVTLEEDPNFLKFSWVNEQLGMVFARQVATVGVGFQTEKFMDEWPEVAQHCVTSKNVYQLDEYEAQRLVQRDPTLVSVFQDYTTPGKLQPKLAAPRKVTPDDVS